MIASQPKSFKISCLLVTLVSAPPNDDQIITSAPTKDEPASGSGSKSGRGAASDRDLAVDSSPNVPRNTSDDSSVTQGWSRCVLQSYVKHLDLEPAYLDVYEHLMRDSGSISPQVLEMVQPFIEDLCTAGGSKGRSLARGVGGTSDVVFLYLVDLYVFLITHCFFDARGRVLLRNATSLLHVPREVYFGLEVALAESLHECEERLARVAAEGGSNSQLKRYLKIGAVGLGAGAVIALTGGLAAPAVAAALVVIGGGAAAAVAGVATFAVLASVFGTAGAGLAGYKMARRTKEVEEFAFEQYGKKGQLSVMIMVSGWLQDKEDFKRAFGVVPTNMTLEETVTRFYQINDPARALNAKDECGEYEKTPDVLVQKIVDKYKKNPLNPRFLSPPYTEFTLTSGQQDLLADCLAKTILKDAPKSSAASGASGTASSSAEGPGEVNVVNAKKGILSKSTSKVMRMTTSIFKSSSKKTDERERDDRASDDEDEDGGMAAAPLLSDTSDQVHLVAAKKPAPVSSSSVAEESAPDASVNTTSSVPHSAVTISTSSVVDTGAVTVTAKTVRSAPSSEPPEAPPTADAVANYDNIMATRYWNWNELDIAPLYELYLLRWETDIQVELGTSIATLMKSLQHAVAEKVVAATVFGALLGAIALPYQLIKLTDIIDNTWVLGLERADDAGKQLAEALLNRPQGSRPVTLVGHSIGARLIFSCLQELARRKELEEQERAKAAGKGRSWFSFGSKKATSASVQQKSSDVSATASARKDDSDDSDDEELFDGTVSPTAAAGVDGEEDEWDPVTSRGATKASANAGATGSGASAAEASSSSTETKATEGGDKSEPTKKSQPSSNSYGIVQDVVLLGLPANASRRAWRRARSVVSGRLINGYSTKDLGLAVLYRWEAKEAISVSGLQSIDDPAAGVENVDLSFMVEKHVEYSLKMKQILAYLDLAAAPSSTSPTATATATST